MEQALALYTRKKTSLGNCWVIKNIEVIDKVPALLESGLAIWLEDEWPNLLAMGDTQRQAWWKRRENALRTEAILRASEPRTVHGPVQAVA